MKTKLFFISILIFAVLTVIEATTVNGKFSVVENNGLNYSVKLQINTDSGTDDMGSSTIVFEFDNQSLTFPGTPVSGLDYEFHNFSGGYYSASTITRPLPNQIRINIELLLNNMGTTVALSPNDWTDIVTLHFTVADPQGTAGLKWLPENFEVFDGNNVNLWEVGEFIDNFNTPTPVELTTFTASAIDNSVELYWESATEINNLGYEIERTINNDNNWTKIGFVDGNGTTSEKRSYNYIDKNPVGGTVFNYRLKQIDNDGSYTYYDAVEVHFLPTEYSLLQNFPNPFNPTTKIRFSVVETQNVKLKIFNALGEEVETVINKEFNPGYHEIDFSGSSLASGMYIYQLEAGSFTDARKMMLLK